MSASGHSTSAEWPGADASQLQREVHVWPVELQAPQGLIDCARSLLTEAEKERADHFRTPQSQNEFVLSRSILRTLLSHFLHSLPERVGITYSEHGKPRLADQSSRIRFNLCHSGQIAAYAVTWDCELGIDVEQSHPGSEMEEIAKRFFSPAERYEIGNLPEIQRATAFFSCWVRKEAYAKALGGGLSIPLNSFRVSAMPSSMRPLVSVRGDDAEAGEWTIQDFSPAPGYLGAIAFRNHERPICLHRSEHAAGVLHWLTELPVRHPNYAHHNIHLR